MRTLFSTGLVGLLLCLIPSKTSAADTFKTDAAGYIRDWVMLAPIALPEGGACGDLILQDQLKGEANLKPKAGDKVKINGQELTWKNVVAATNFFDFNAVLKTENDRSAGFIVTYIECDREMFDVTMTVASNDQGRIYLNGTDIYAFTEARTLELDADKGKVTLNRGLNVVVFKIINEQGNWQGAMRFLGKADAPLKDLRIKLSP